MDRRTEAEVVRLLGRHRPFVRASVVRTAGSVPGKIGATMVVRDDGTTVGTVGGAALEEEVKRLAGVAIERHRGDLVHFDLAAWKPGGLPSLCGGSVDIAIEYVAPRPNVLLWGGGHVAEAVARLLPGLEIDHSVADDREEYVGPAKFPLAERREVVAPAELFERFAPAEFTHLLVLGYDAMKDLEVLYRATQRFPNTIGLIASAPKREHLYARLRERGVAREALARIRSPVGLPIGAESPAEIAISIVAEIVRDLHPSSLRAPASRSREVRAERDGGNRRD
jgi:xanthine dehydrogenase accessory factor